MFKLQYEPFELLHKSVNDFDFNLHDPEQIEQAMVAIMGQNNGLGLAANQIGLDARIFVMGSNKIDGFCTPQAFINPVIVNQGEEMNIDREGCLSFPRLWLKVKRPTWVEAEYQNIKGDKISVRIDGYMAKCFQHEIDHLDGICFTDRVGKLKLDMAIKKLYKQHRR